MDVECLGLWRLCPSRAISALACGVCVCVLRIDHGAVTSVRRRARRPRAAAAKSAPAAENRLAQGLS